jgi:hypothetical protein
LRRWAKNPSNRYIAQALLHDGCNDLSTRKTRPFFIGKL